MTTTTATQSKNRPAFALFTTNRHQRSNVGVVFENHGEEALTILVGERGHPDQRRFALYATPELTASEGPSPLPVGELFDVTDGPADFNESCGFAYRRGDGSYDLVLKLEVPAWTEDDLFTTEVRQTRINMRRIRA